jgi:RND superfamily putative drug exporter
MEELSDKATAMGKAFECRQKRPLVLLTSGSLRQPGLQTSHEFVPVTRRESRTYDHFGPGHSATPEGISRINAIKTAAEESLKGTPLEDAKIYLAGTVATFKDAQDGAKYDLLIAGIASLCLIFIIMLIITRSFVAALVIVGTVALSLGASFGLSVLVWQ